MVSRTRQRCFVSCGWRVVLKRSVCGREGERRLHELMVGWEPVAAVIGDEGTGPLYIDESGLCQCLRRAPAHDAVSHVESAGEDEINPVAGFCVVGPAGFRLLRVPHMGERLDRRPRVGWADVR